MSSSPPNSVASNGERQFGCGIPAVILYPSLGAPTFVVEPDQPSSSTTVTGHIHLLLLSKEELTPGEVNERLRLYQEFEYLRRVEKSAPLPPGRLNREPHPNPVNKPLCIESAAIEVRRIEAEGDRISIPGLELHGYLNTETLSLWRSADPMGVVLLEWLYHVTIDLARLSSVHADTAKKHRFFITWSDFGTAPPPPSQRPDSRNFQDQALDEILTKPRRSTPEAPPFLGKRLVETLRQAAEGHSLGMAGLDPDGLKPDPGLPVTTYHPVYRRPRRQLTPPQKKAKADSVPVVEAMNLGVISDLHLVTKFQILKNSQIRVAHDLPTHFEHQPPPKNDSSADGSKGSKSSETPASDDLDCWDKIKPSEFLPPIGPMISDSVKVLKSHFEAMAKNDPGKSPDAVLVVGDLIDFHRDNFPSDPTVLNPPKKDASPQEILEHAQAIWKAVRVPAEVFLESTKERILEPNYQHGTSYLGILHLLARFVTESPKPVFVVAGNHDAYADPFGLSPRVAFSDDQNAKEYQKANEGIPCDTNLTILEAATCFGNSYGNFCRQLNLDPPVFQVFHLLISPFRTWSLRLGSRQQLAFLHWGESEEMLTHAEDASGSLMPGHLPHAPQALSASDLDLVRALAKDSPSIPLTLVSHYTFACFAPTVPLFTNGDQRATEGNLGKFSVEDVRSKSADTVVDSVLVPVAGAVGGAIVGAAAGIVVGGVIGGGIEAAPQAREGDADGALNSFIGGAQSGAATGAIAGAVAGGIIGAGAGGYMMTKGATLNTLMTPSSFLELPNVFNWGTFHHKRKELFELLYKGCNQGVSLTISGHAHRASFYALEVPQSGASKVPDEIVVRGFHYEDYANWHKDGRSIASDGKPDQPPALMVVSDSAGPIPRRNIAGLLEGWGSQKPSWTFIRFGSDLQPLDIESRFTEHERAKPRLAVVLDYLESTVGHSKHLAKSSTGEMLGVTLFTRPIFGHIPKIDDPMGGGEDTPANFIESLKNGADKPLWVSWIPAPPTLPPQGQESSRSPQDLPEIHTPENASPHMENATEAYRRAVHGKELMESRKAGTAPAKKDYLVDPEDEKSWASHPEATSLFPDVPKGVESGITFRTNIFSAFVSRPFKKNDLMDFQVIHLVNHGGAIQLPPGCAIKSILLWMQVKTKPSSASTSGDGTSQSTNTRHILFRISPQSITDQTPNKAWELREVQAPHTSANTTQAPSILDKLLQPNKGLIFDGFLRYEFSPLAGATAPVAYDLDSPWIVACKGAITPLPEHKGSFRLIFYRDIWPCERPDFKKFGAT